MKYKKILLASILGLLSIGAVFGDDTAAEEPSFYTIADFPGGKEIPSSNGVEIIVSRNVKLDENITPTANIGNATAGTTIECKDQTVQWLLKELLAKDRQPEVELPKINEFYLTAQPSVYAEVGTVVTPSYSIEESLGSYTYGVVGTSGSTTNGCTWNKFVITWSDGSTKEVTSTSGNLTSFKVLDTTDLYIKRVTGYYTSGGTPQTYNKATSTVTPISAGSSFYEKSPAASGSAHIKGYRKWFVYTGSKKTTLNSSLFRNVSIDKCGWGAEDTTKIAVGSGIDRIAIALPKPLTLKSARNLSTGMDEISWFNAPVTVNISGATAGEDMKEYNVYVWDRADSVGQFTPTTFEFLFE